MFGVSLNELLVVLVVALIFAKPGDLPAIAKGYKAFIKSAAKLKREAERYLVDVHNSAIDFEEANIDDQDLKTLSLDKSQYVIDDAGKVCRSYDISGLKKKKS